VKSEGAAYVATGEITALEHEVGNDSVEFGARVAVAKLAGAESDEVLHGLGDDIIVELEVNTSALFCNNMSVGIEWNWCDNHREAARLCG
jgi:hypothetical protein